MPKPNVGRLLPLLLSALPVLLPPTVVLARDPELRSAAVVVVDDATGKVLYSRAADKAVPIASITKLMMSLVVLEAGQPLDEQLVISPADRRLGSGAPSRLAVGTRVSRGELLHLALMASENRAASAVGRAYPGGIDAVVAAMNRKARALGMSHAHFVDPVGISSDNVASARDLLRLLAAAAENPTIRDFSTDYTHSVTVGRQQLSYRNTNSLVGKDDWDVIVQKTGYLQAAGRCLAMQAVIDGHTVSMVFLNSFGKYTRTAEARRVRRWLEDEG